jgi:hypothetical protein
VRRHEILLVEICPGVDNENHEEHQKPAIESADSTPNLLPVKDKVTNEDGPKDLRYPGREVVETTRTDGEYSAIVIVVFCRTYQQTR